MLSRFTWTRWAVALVVTAAGAWRIGGWTSIDRWARVALGVAFGIVAQLVAMATNPRGDR